MHRLSFASGLRRRAATLGLASLSVLGGPTAGHAALLFAEQGFRVSGSSNLFCGTAHSNGSVDVTGNGNLVSGTLEYGSTVRSNGNNTLDPVKAPAAPMPQPPHDLDYYRNLARTQGTYYPGNASLGRTALSGLIFAEGDIRISGTGSNGAVTLVAAGAIKLSGSAGALRASVDELLFFAGAGDIAISGNNHILAGAMYAPAGQLSRRGSDGDLGAGPLVARAIRVSGARGHAGGQCCIEDAECGEGESCGAEGICVQTPTEVCTDGADNDGDGQTDCNDTDCASAPNCGGPTENCTDGADNDGDGLVDCADSDCATAPTCTSGVELCGDCRDNDGDGMTDAEDPDCCTQPMALTVKRLKMRTVRKKHRDNLKLRAIYAPVMPDRFDPLTQDTSIQIADRDGQVFCTTVAANHFMPFRRNKIAFWDKSGEYANGLTDGAFVLKNDGSIRFRTHGKKARMRHTDSRSLRITLRVGNQCSQASTTLRAKKTVLLFP